MIVESIGKTGRDGEACEWKLAIFQRHLTPASNEDSSKVVKEAKEVMNRSPLLEEIDANLIRIGLNAWFFVAHPLLWRRRLPMLPWDLYGRLHSDNSFRRRPMHSHMAHCIHVHTSICIQRICVVPRSNTYTLQSYNNCLAFISSNSMRGRTLSMLHWNV